MTKQELKAICRFARNYKHPTPARTTESWQAYRDAIRISQEQGLDDVHYSRGCSLKFFVANITSIIYGDWIITTIKKWDNTDLKTLEPMIGKALGYKPKP